MWSWSKFKASYAGYVFFCFSLSEISSLFSGNKTQGQLPGTYKHPGNIKIIDRFTLEGALWVIRANLLRSKAVKQMFFYIYSCSDFTSGDETYTAGRETPILGLPVFFELME